MIVLIRGFILILLIYLAYNIIKYITHPKRRFEYARRRHQLYLLDEKDQIQKNFLLTYKGMVFEGEKFTNPSSRPQVVSIFIWPHQESTIIPSHEVKILEQHILQQYPNAHIDWKNVQAAPK
ncbi:cbb3-type cytochrome oxidase subunit 3 [Oikeobacillus pervagus]|uniref:Cbb3-type cytochrome oxidase subunit 3 n=1 Tax=Oikeobacillus pervagus TaxID=1325931 RepID=A0AAJ1WJH2_9BACI|nr:sigma-w pathway protein ysdB [Oikeobacillus pervagus]MDQ0215463.1 cbb3-type cytochrome oxidase subunit 3 [Oikeobacillus pervagus]